MTKNPLAKVSVLCLSAVVLATSCTTPSSEENSTTIETPVEVSSPEAPAETAVETTITPETMAPASTAPAETAGPNSGSVGDKLRNGSYSVLVHSATDPYMSSSEWSTPAEGMRWVVVDVEVFNETASPQSVSSMLCFELSDSTNRNYTAAITGESLPSIDGDVGPGGSRRGSMVFEIPSNSSDLNLKFNCDILSSSYTTVSL